LSPGIPRDVVVAYCLEQQQNDFVWIEQLRRRIMKYSRFSMTGGDRRPDGV
jgi:hypothetical protein